MTKVSSTPVGTLYRFRFEVRLDKLALIQSLKNLWPQTGVDLWAELRQAISVFYEKIGHVSPLLRIRFVYNIFDPIHFIRDVLGYKVIVDA